MRKIQILKESFAKTETIIISINNFYSLLNESFIYTLTIERNCKIKSFDKSFSDVNLTFHDFDLYYENNPNAIYSSFDLYKKSG